MSDLRTCRGCGTKEEATYEPEPWESSRMVVYSCKCGKTVSFNWHSVLVTNRDL